VEPSPACAKSQSVSIRVWRTILYWAVGPLSKAITEWINKGKSSDGSLNIISGLASERSVL
ncbi:MAG TPA: hypothetical protein VJ180_11355, partial [Pyrinomonadaceae bacterium]|nr:hypothetical protein [Pyrinomonadaceae bacterium]